MKQFLRWGIGISCLVGFVALVISQRVTPKQKVEPVIDQVTLVGPASREPFGRLSVNQASIRTHPGTQLSTYSNKKYGYKFDYPSDWTIYHYGAKLDESKVYLFRPASATRFDDKNAPESYSNDLSVSFWRNIDEFIGHYGNLHPMRSYNSISDYLSNHRSFHRVLGTTLVGGRKAYKLILGGGASANYSLVVEHNGLYHFSFDTAYDEFALTEEQRNIIASIRFE